MFYLSLSINTVLCLTMSEFCKAYRVAYMFTLHSTSTMINSKHSTEHFLLKLENHTT